MRNILEVQMLRYSKIMLGNCSNIQSFLLSLIMSCYQWVIRSPDWPNHSFLTTIKLFSPTLPLHTLLFPLQSPMVGWILDRVPGHTNIGRSRNFVHQVTGHTPGQINRNGTVLDKDVIIFNNQTLWWVDGNTSTHVHAHLETDRTPLISVITPSWRICRRIMEMSYETYQSPIHSAPERGRLTLCGISNSSSKMTATTCCWVHNGTPNSSTKDNVP